MLEFSVDPRAEGMQGELSVTQGCQHKSLLGSHSEVWLSSDSGQNPSKVKWMALRSFLHKTMGLLPKLVLGWRWSPWAWVGVPALRRRAVYPSVGSLKTSTVVTA